MFQLLCTINLRRFLMCWPFFEKLLRRLGLVIVKWRGGGSMGRILRWAEAHPAHPLDSSLSVVAGYGLMQTTFMAVGHTRFERSRNLKIVLRITGITKCHTYVSHRRVLGSIRPPARFVTLRRRQADSKVVLFSKKIKIIFNLKNL